ncbi:hypothetical protein GCM10028806_28380 [Spirosoma terrae]|uniref:Terminase small subunit n=1 Tax=Spirosoma terrae TaxID=1968276 RepID=A0A6L9LCU9_9BACT|nr:terminase small subunit [Spirosoma terrae]NDU97202.1 hypothetical protein [Spirosoma terrae]
MSDLEQKFVEEYPKDCNGARAAVRAGFAKSRAKQTAWDLLQRKDIRDAIEERLKLFTISADEAAKNISDIARTRLNDFIKVRKVLKTEVVRRPLQFLIDKAKKELELESAILFELEWDGDEDRDKKRQEAKVKDIERRIQRYTIELRHNAKAYRDVDDEPKWVEQAYFDLVELSRAYDVGNIHEYSVGEFGPKIKMYPADKANEIILKLNGKLVDRTDHTSKGESVNKGFYDFLKKVNTKK